VPTENFVCIEVIDVMQLYRQAFPVATLGRDEPRPISQKKEFATFGGCALITHTESIG